MCYSCIKLIVVISNTQVKRVAVDYKKPKAIRIWTGDNESVLFELKTLKDFDKSPEYTESEVVNMKYHDMINDEKIPLDVRATLKTLIGMERFKNGQDQLED